MVATPHIETKSTFEPRNTAAEPAPGGTHDAKKIGLPGSKLAHTARTSTPSVNSQHDHAFTVRLSSDARKLSANNSNAPQAADSGLKQKIDTTAVKHDKAPVDHSIDSVESGKRTNQVTSFESERTGNDTNDKTEAGRTLGQVIDTFA